MNPSFYGYRLPFHLPSRVMDRDYLSLRPWYPIGSSTEKNKKVWLTCEGKGRKKTRETAEDRKSKGTQIMKVSDISQIAAGVLRGALQFPLSTNR